MSIPTSWQQVPLGELCEKLRDGSHNPPPAQSAGAPMLSARNITGRKVAFDEYRLISPQDFDEENRRTTVTEGDVLLTIVGAIGRSAVVTANYPPFTLQRSVAVLRQRAGDPRFLSYAFQAPLFQQYLNENAKGTAQKGIYLKALAGAEVPVAPVEEQRRIADKLDTVLARVDGVKDRLDRVAPLLKRFRQSVLGVATSGLTTKSDMGSAAHSSWRSTSLGEVCRKITDGEHLTPKRSESGRHLLSARNVRDGFIDLRKVCKTLSTQAAEVARGS